MKLPADKQFLYLNWPEHGYISKKKSRPNLEIIMMHNTVVCMQSNCPAARPPETHARSHIRPSLG